MKCENSDIDCRQITNWCYRFPQFGDFLSSDAIFHVFWGTGLVTWL